MDFSLMYSFNSISDCLLHSRTGKSLQNKRTRHCSYYNPRNSARPSSGENLNFSHLSRKCLFTQHQAQKLTHGSSLLGSYSKHDDAHQIKQEGNENGGTITTTEASLRGEAFIRPHLLQLAPYTPIVPFEILSAKLGREPQDIVKLDANENPYGPPPEVLEVLGNIEFPYIYPDPESRRLRAALAKDSGLEAEHILVGCGADELIDLIMRCTIEPGDAIIDCPPTFTMYVFDADVNGAKVVTVPRKSDFSLDVDGIIRAVNQHSPKVIFLTSPNNPDGSLISERDLMEILKLPILVVLDEAYIEFSGEPSRITWVKDYENLVVLRTFSKRAGLAGLRVGYGGFPLGIIKYLWRAKQPYNVSVAAELAACAALENPSYLEMVKEALVTERERLFGLLQQVPMLSPFPSHANFILCAVKDGSMAGKIKNDLAEEGVMVRHYNKKELSGFIRISVGKPQHTDALMKALEKVLR